MTRSTHRLNAGSSLMYHDYHLSIEGPGQGKTKVVYYISETSIEMIVQSAVSSTTSAWSLHNYTNYTCREFIQKPFDRAKEVPLDPDCPYDSCKWNTLQLLTPMIHTASVGQKNSACIWTISKKNIGHVSVSEDRILNLNLCDQRILQTDLKLGSPANSKRPQHLMLLAPPPVGGDHPDLFLLGLVHRCTCRASQCGQCLSAVLRL